MSEKITDYIEVSTLPTDTLFDVSIDVDTTPKTRSISKENLSSELGLFYSSDGTISDALRTVDLTGNSLLFTKGRIGFNGVPTVNEGFLVSRRAIGEAVLRVKGGVSGNSEYFLVDDGGFVGINGATQSSSEALGVSGSINCNNILSLAYSGSTGVARSINGALRVEAGSTTSTNYGVSIMGSGTSPVRINLSEKDNTTVGIGFGNVALNNNEYDFDFVGFVANPTIRLKAPVTSSGSQIGRSPSLKLDSQWWDGSSSQLKTSTIVHNQGATGQESQLDFNIDGVDLLTIDEDNTAGNTRLMLYDVDSGSMVRVSVGADDSAGVGFKTLRIPN